MLMKLVYRIAIVNIFIALLLTWLFQMDHRFTPRDLLTITGAVFIVTGVFDLMVSGVLFLAGNRDWAKGFLLGAGILLLAGSGACSSLLVLSR